MVNEKRMQGQYLQITSSIHGQKKPKKRPLHPLRVKYWGQKHIGSSYFCELSLHTEFQRPSTYPSGRKVTTWREEEERQAGLSRATLESTSFLYNSSLVDT